MSWSVSISGHGDSPAGASCWYSKSDGTSKSASYSGPVREVAEKAATFIEECQHEEAEREAAPKEEAHE